MQSLITIAITAVAALAAGSVMVFIYWSVLSREDDRQAQLARRLGTANQDTEDNLFLAQPTSGESAGLGSLGARLNMLLVEAGMPYDLNGLMVRCIVAALIGGIVLGIISRGPFAVFGVGCCIIPVLMLNSKATERARNLSEQLPDALDLVARSLQAGHGLADAMKLCSEEMPSPVADEFGRVFEENSLGRDLRESFETLSLRNPRNFDLKLFVSSVLLQRDTGGNLIEILGNISKTIRDRFVFEAKVRALTAEARISAIILGSLPFAILGLIAWMRPNYLMPLWDDPFGNQLVAAALVWFAIGTLIMRNVSTVEV
jgi:tight adherence protein B